MFFFLLVDFLRDGQRVNVDGDGEVEQPQVGETLDDARIGRARPALAVAFAVPAIFLNGKFGRKIPGGVKVKTVGQRWIQKLFVVLEMVHVRHRQDARAGAGKNIHDLAVNVFKLAPQLVEDRPVILAQRGVAVRQPGGVFQRPRNVNDDALPPQFAFHHCLPVTHEPLVARTLRPGIFKAFGLLLEPE